MDSKTSTVELHWVDYLIFAVTLLIPLTIGIYHSVAKGGQKSTMKYLLGNKTMMVIPVAVSTAMSNISGVMVLGQTAEVYLYGTQYFTSHVFAFSIVNVSAFLFLPMIYKLKITSMFEYHKRRFNSRVLHKICVFNYMMFIISYSAIALFAPAVALEAVTGLPVWATLLSAGGVGLIYTSIGGILGVVWTDFFQGFIFFGGLILVLIVGSIKVGGLSSVWQISQQGKRIEFFNMNPDPTIRISFITTLIFSLNYISVVATEQSIVQRTSAMPTLKNAFQIIIAILPFMFLTYIVVFLTGLVLYAFYDSIGCDPFRSRLINNINQILPYFIVNDLKIIGITGLLMSILFSGSLSTTSTTSNSMAAIVWKDILEPYAKKFSEHKKTILIKITAFVFGVVSIVLALSFQYFQGNISQLTAILLNLFSSPLSGVFLAGCFIPWVNAKGMIVGILASISISFWLVLGQFLNYPHISYLPTTVANCTPVANATYIPLILQDRQDVFVLYRISFQYFGVISIVVCLIVGVFVSFVTKRQNSEVIDKETLFDVKDISCCYVCQRDDDDGSEIFEHKKGNIFVAEKDGLPDIFTTKL